MSEGVHIRAIEKFNPEKPDGDRMLVVEIYPLPNDQLLLAECYAAARTAVHRVLEAKGIVSKVSVEIPPAGDTSRKH